LEIILNIRRIIIIITDRSIRRLSIGGCGLTADQLSDDKEKD